VRSSVKHITNLTQAHAILQAEPMTTRRRFAAIVGLIIFMSHTTNIGIWRFFSLQRAYARLTSPSSPEIGDVLWDAPLQLVQTVRADLAQVVGLILANKPAPIRPLRPPGRTNADYDTIAIVDASGTGYAFYVMCRAGAFLVTCGWPSAVAHSTKAEPRSATEALRWIASICDLGHTAMVSDHEALATGQRRWWSGHGGFSPAFFLNDFYLEFYGTVDLSTWRRDVFHVEGDKNIVDGPSRSVAIGEPLRVRPANIVFPDVSSYRHPYAGHPPRDAWQT
jgi:hypothetical protein